MGCLTSEEENPEGLPPTLCSCASPGEGEGGEVGSLNDEVADVIEGDVTSVLGTVGAGITGVALEPRREREPLPPPAEDDVVVVDDGRDDIDNKGKRSKLFQKERLSVLKAINNIKSLYGKKGIKNNPLWKNVVSHWKGDTNRI
jgi:hypothetical protein